MVSITSCERPLINNLYIDCAKPTICPNSIFGGMASAFGSVMILTSTGPSSSNALSKVVKGQRNNLRDSIFKHII